MPCAWAATGTARAAASAAAMAMRVELIGSSMDDDAGVIRQTRHETSLTGRHRTAIVIIARGHGNLFDKPGNALLAPGDFVRHPGRPDWGIGQIQSMIGHRITVNFENAGKVVIDGNVVELAPAGETPR